jgi:hypothetical protein
MQLYRDRLPKAAGRRLQKLRLSQEWNEFVDSVLIGLAIGLTILLLVSFFSNANAQSTSLPPQCGGACSIPDSSGVSFITALKDKCFAHGSFVDHREAVSLGLANEYLPPG